MLANNSYSPVKASYPNYTLNYSFFGTYVTDCKKFTATQCFSVIAGYMVKW